MSVSVRGLHFAYGKRPMLRGISFAVPDGALASLLGPNGAGKSTLIKCMLGLCGGYQGQVLLGGEDIRGMGARALAQRVAYIPQRSYPAFNYSVLDMVLMGASARVGAWRAPGPREREGAMQALARMGLCDYAERDFSRLSGGERQLVLIARALAQDSRILILDEPTGGLDFGNQIVVMDRLRALARQGYTVIQSTHNPEQACRFSDLLLAMKEGRLIADGPPSQVLSEELMFSLYGVHTRIVDFADGTLRVCVPLEEKGLEIV